MKVLIAEDNALWRKLLERNVTSWGYRAVLAEDGQTAWDILQREDAPRLAILDWQMPELDGIEVCHRVKRDNNLPFTYVIILTSRDAKEDMVAGLDAGADDYLTKPVEATVLRSRLSAAKRIVELVPPKEWARPRVPGYEVEQLLGKGAFATVWRATHSQSQRQVALKIIRVDLATEEVFDRFAREVQLMQKMDHPNIAQIYDSRIDKQLGYYAMELIDGVTLDKYVREQRPKAARLLELTAQIADALDHAHRQDIVHRDLKPSNIMVTADAEPKLVDFGLAKTLFVADADSATGQTLDGAVVGTPMFMAPEQARGENEHLDGRTDVYALGIILYVMILRKHPHKVDRQDRWQTIREIAEGDVCLPSEIVPKFNRNLERIMMKALAEDPANRYQTAAEFAAAVREFLAERIAALRVEEESAKDLH